MAGGAALPLGVVALTELFSGLFGLAIGGSSGLAEGLALGLFALGNPFVLLPVLLGALGVGLVLAIVGVVLYGSVRGAHPNLEAELDTAKQREQALDRSVTPAAGGAVIFKF